MIRTKRIAVAVQLHKAFVKGLSLIGILLRPDGRERRMMRGLPLPGPFRVRHGRHQSAGTVTVDSEPDTGIPIHRMPRFGTQGPVPQTLQPHVRSRSKGQRGTGTGNDDRLV